MEAKSVAKNYLFLTILVAAMVAGAFFGWINPEGGHSIAFLGTIFIRMMFCVVVPMVFASVAGAIANIKSRARAGKIMFMTILNFVITAAIAGAIYFVLVM
ncbi:MAG: cation:dicarboxylase symporter family transporter, partial [Synergistaceae bacterium]|nr:cation:dicarboxylase symporter family transporter [Synergistaceae bacterium]